MNKILWSNEYSLEHDEIDQQHKSLLKLINKLADNYETTDNAFITELINEIVEYTKYHLKYEEELLEKIKYSHLESHKNSHMLFLIKAKQYAINSYNISTYEIADFLTSWWYQHVKYEDMKFKTILKNL